ncbi:MAG TPA: DNA polymerase III subunit delta [Acidimicrobiales bacterium]|nr:DNA polymerase III subunit delta [Acidimicrobiales bacterium]
MSKPGPLAWLIVGEDPSLVSEELSRLVRQLVGDQDRSLVLEEMASADDAELFAVVDACRTPPFLSDRRVVVVRELGRFGPDQLAPVLSYLEEPMSTTRLVLVSGGGTLPSKFVTAFKAAGCTEVVGTDVSPREARNWVAEKVAASGVKLVPAALVAIQDHLGEDLNRLSSVLATLESAYGTGARLGPEQVAPYLGEAGAVPPWDLTDAIDRGDAETALTLLHRLTGAGDRHPLVVLAILSRHYSNMLKVQSPSIATEAQAAAALGIAKGRSTFPAKKALDAARRLGPSGVGDAVIALAEAELALKGKIDWEGDLVLEVLIARLCRLSRSARARSGTASGRR